MFRPQSTFTPPAGSMPALTIRPSGPQDERAIARLAELDGQPMVDGPYLVAEVEGGLRAALPLARGPVVADPFRPTEGLVRLLELRAAQLPISGARRHQGPDRGRPAAIPPSTHPFSPVEALRAA